MRKASQDNGLIVEDGKLIGIALGYDYCAEHEWGIEELRRICEIPVSSNLLKSEKHINNEKK